MSPATAPSTRYRAAHPADLPRLLGLADILPTAPHWSREVWSQLLHDANAPIPRETLVHSPPPSDFVIPEGNLRLARSGEAAGGLDRSPPSALVLIAEEIQPVGETSCIGLLVARRTLDIVEIESVAVHPTHRRRGIARALCDHALRWAVAHHATTVQLEVRASNHPARALYAALHFHQQGTRKDYYRHPTEDAILLAATILGTAASIAP